VTHTHDDAPGQTPAPHGAPDEPGPPQPYTDGFALDRHLGIAIFCAVGGLLLLVGISFLPLRYAVLTPGPIYNTLGEVDGHPLIAVSGHQTYPATGQLDLTTVSVYGGPGDKVRLPQVIRGWLDPADTVLPVDQVFPPGTTEEQEEKQNEADMVNSQESATAAALDELGIDYTTVLTVVDTSSGTPAAEVFEKGDVILALNGVPIDDFDALRKELQQVEPGDEVTVKVRRDGAEQDLQVATVEGDDGKARLGVIVETTFDFPFDIDIKIDNVGGPSAGTMFALGIVDRLTPGAMTGGKRIAGTGTIEPSGAVGPIGGIVQKVNGARDSGAEYFLVPADNCEEVRGHVPDGLTTVRISTLHEARTAAEAIGSGKSLADLPSCN
jgi:PDZ domain-containing protein